MTNILNGKKYKEMRDKRFEYPSIPVIQAEMKMQVKFFSLKRKPRFQQLFIGHLYRLHWLEEKTFINCFENFEKMLLLLHQTVTFAFALWRIVMQKRFNPMRGSANQRQFMMSELCQTITLANITKSNRRFGFEF